MASDDSEEDLILETLIDHNFEQILAPEKAKSLDVFLVNNLSLIINSFIDENVNKMYSIENKNLSDHNAFKTEINLNQRLIETRKDDKVKYAFKRADWSAINTTIINRSRRRRLPVVDPTSWAPQRCKWRQAPPPLPLGREKLRSLRVFGYGASEAGQAAPSAHPYTTTPLRH